MKHIVMIPFACSYFMTVLPETVRNCYQCQRTPVEQSLDNRTRINYARFHKTQAQKENPLIMITLEKSQSTLVLYATVLNQ